ncbi:MAG: 7-cyano-7-deazaguanine synthase [Elusimicrobia bacterium]|nr:7-cyano-7-deazaguanine synthase [Elusimicrobiota bacterium]
MITKLGGSSQKTVGVLVSGGLDSAVLVAELAKQAKPVVPIYLRGGLRWESVELWWLRRFLRAVSRDGIAPLVTLHLPLGDAYRDHWSLNGGPVPDARSSDQAVYLPGRNLLLCGKAAVFCALRGIPQLALGLLHGNPFADSTPAFFVAFEQAATQALGQPVTFLTPFARLSKPQVIRLGRRLPLALTFSCLNPRGRFHCGVCNKCEERRQAFRAARMKDPTEYRREL